MPSPKALSASRTAPATAASSSARGGDRAHALAAAAGRCLDQQREADPLRLGRDRRGLGAVVEVGAGQDRDAGPLHHLPGADLRAHRLDRLRRRPDQDEARLGDGAGEAGVLGEEAVAGVDGVGAGAAGRVEDRVDAQVGLGRGRAAERDGLVGLVHERRARVGLGEDGDGADAHPPAAGEDAARDLAAVGDEHLRDRGALAHLYIRKTPKRREPATSLPWQAESAMPSAVRVSRGSIMASSQSSPEETKASDSFSI